MAKTPAQRDEEVRNPASLICEIGNFGNRGVASVPKIEESWGRPDGMNFVSHST